MRMGSQEVLRKEPRLRDEAVGRVLGLVDHRAGQQPVHDLNSHEVEHDRAQDLVHVEIGLEGAGDRPPGRAAGGAGEKHERYQLDTGQVRERERGRRARPGPHRQLAFAADVEDIGAEGDADPDGDEKKRRRLDGRRAERVAAVECPDDQRVVAADRVGAQGEHHDRPEQQRHDQRERQGEPAQEDPPSIPPGVRHRLTEATHELAPGG